MGILLGRRLAQGSARPLPALSPAGFYTALWAPLPFAFGPVPRERYAVFVVERPLILEG